MRRLEFLCRGEPCGNSVFMRSSKHETPLLGAAHTAARKKGCPDKTQYRVAH
nr:MAG TPA: hypothetical protein [Caudoviricetes sp.]